MIVNNGLNVSFKKKLTLADVLKISLHRKHAAEANAESCNYSEFMAKAVKNTPWFEALACT